MLPRVIAVLCLFPVSGMLIAAKSQTPSPRLVVHARKFAFVPGEISLKRGQSTSITFISDDESHGLAVKELGIDIQILKDHPREIVVTPAAAGDFTGSCSVFCGTGHRDMELLIHVVE